MSGPSRAAADGSQKELGVKCDTSVTDPPNNKALTAWNDSMIIHRIFLNPAQVHDPRFVKKSFSMIYTSLIHLAHALFSALPSIPPSCGIICTKAHMVLDPSCLVSLLFSTSCG